MSDFVHLHVHSHYSVVDGACRIDDLLDRANRYGMKSLALTDHGNLFGAVEFYTSCEAAGVKPIIGYEAYVAPTSRHDRSASSAAEASHHLVLLAENAAGYRNLLWLASAAYQEGYHYHPRIDREILAEHSEGLIAMSACLAGEIPGRLAEGDAEGARAAARRYLNIFGTDHFFLELQENGIAEQAVANRGLVELSRSLGLKCVATNDIHYTDESDHGAHDVLLCIGTGRKRADQSRMRFDENAYFFPSGEQMAELFQEFPEALANTVEIAERCNATIETGTYRMPVFDVPEGESIDSHLHRLAESGTRERYGTIEGRIGERMNFELDVICRMGFPGYMLIVADLVRFAREQGIPVGPGRGSAAGSLVCYALGITKLDPFKYDLLFERFINPGRNEMPDIDLDFCQSRREEVIEYARHKYGSDHVARIITFYTLSAKAAIRDVGRVLDVPLGAVDSIAKLVPGTAGITLARALEQEPDLKNRYNEDPQCREIIDIARRLEGLARQPGKHAAGVVIADRPLVEYCPLYVQPGTDEVATQFEMTYVDKIGLLKVDFLGLQTLTLAHLAAQFVRERGGPSIDLDAVPLDDAKTLDLFAAGDTTGIFQFESCSMREMLTRVRPDRFTDLIAMNAMYRPWSMEHIATFIERKFGREPVPRIDPKVDPILEETFGIMIYQEQVMRIAQTVAGFSLSDADHLRRALGKKKHSLMVKYEEQFVAGAIAGGMDAEKARAIYDLMARSASYAFDKSHSAAYAFLAFRTAYMKVHYPTEFMSALITLNLDKTDMVAEYTEDARRMGITILPPSVSKAGRGFGGPRPG